METWQSAQKHEIEWWEKCHNTYYEEEKQLRYAKKMGLRAIPNAKTPYAFDMGGRSVIDIGGGPTSLLLKCSNVKGVVIDPMEYPAWVNARYQEAGIEYRQEKGEDIDASDIVDEVWLYNTLQHVDDPEKVIQNARRVGKLIRIFEWVDALTNDCHIHKLDATDLDRWLGGKGTLESVNEKDSIKMYYGKFEGVNENIIHFILTSGELIYPYYLAIMSALRTQQADKFILWSIGTPKGEYWEFLKDDVELRLIEFPDIVGMPDKTGIPYREQVNDLLKWKILYEHGGIYLDLDTFCLDDITHFLKASEKELVLAHEVEDSASSYPFFNASIVMAKQHSQLMLQILTQSESLREDKEIKRGAMSAQLTAVTRNNIDKIDTVEYGVLGGGGTDKIAARLALEEGELWEQAKVLHLFGHHAPFFKSMSEEFIRDSDILFAKTVRNTLSPQEWGPHLSDDDSSDIIITDDATNLSEMNVHFVTTGPKFSYIYYLGIMTALKAYGDKVILWYTQEPESKYFEFLKGKVRMKEVKTPESKYFEFLKGKVRMQEVKTPDFPALSKLEEHLKRVCVFDWTVWNAAYRMGGMIMGLDSLTLKTHFDLFRTDTEILAPIDDPGTLFFGMHGVIIRKGSVLAKEIIDKATENLNTCNETIKWGDAGMTPYVHLTQANLDKLSIVPFQMVCGRRPDLFMEGATMPHDGVRTIPLYSSSAKIDVTINEDYIEKSESPYAKIVKKLLSPSEWNPEEIAPPQVCSSIRHKRFHLLSLPHVAANRKELCCAFSHKVIKMGKMLKSMGHTVYFYGVEGSEVECDEFIQVSTQAIIDETYGVYDTSKETYRHRADSVATKVFNENCIREIRKRMQSNDFLLIPFSPTVYKQLIDDLRVEGVASNDGLHMIVESGIGYRGTYCRYRVFESVSQMHYNYGLEGVKGLVNELWYDCVIPNYFDPDDFTFSDKKDEYILFLARVISRKGVATAISTTRETGMKLIIAGQDGGEGLNLDHPHVEYVGFADYEKRRELLSKAKALILPTQYIGPFEGVIIEAAFSGTPVITSDWGAFPELVRHGQTGYRCRTLDHFVWAVKNIGNIKPIDCYKYAMANFSLDRVRLMYEEYWDMLLDVKENVDGKGWSRIHPERTNLDWLVKH